MLSSTIRNAVSFKQYQALQKRFKTGPFGYTQAKALVYEKCGEPTDVLYLHQHSISPSLASQSLLLKTLASPINPADINQIQGTYPSRPPFSAFLGTPAPSAVGGNEGCFEVVSVGSSVKTVKKGDWVIQKSACFGSWRTHVLTDEEHVIQVEKEGLTPEQVGSVSINPCTAYRMLKDFEELHQGDWWIQNGANSGVGRAAIQLGKLWGLRSINIIRDRPKAEETEVLRTELLELGATHVVTENELLGNGIRERISEWTNRDKEKIRLGLNCVGGKATSALVKCLGEKGHLVTYGGMSRKPLEVPASRLIFSDLRFSGFWVSRWAAENPAEKKRIVDEILSLIRAGSFRDVPFDKITWTWDTEEKVLRDAIQPTLSGFKPGKGIFVFENT
ncbi:hypothetical protein K3495_g14783 [Podosphaera aphanis]|nr:hypothetical protein K3495_g14783 [Podosphaera aphanis]